MKKNIARCGLHDGPRHRRWAGWAVGLGLLSLTLSACTPAAHAPLAEAASASAPVAQADKPAYDAALIAMAMKEAYLGPARWPDPNALIGPPPAQGSTAHNNDLAASAVALGHSAGPRFALAALDAELFAPQATDAFSCAAQIAIGPETTPAIDRLLRRSMIDFGFATSAAKKKYNRARPFMENGQPSCSPKEEAYLRQDGSYPSGHSAIGYGWGLVLAQLLPERAAALHERGRSFGDSRRYCNVHWQSDIEAGRTVAEAVAAALPAEPRYQADFAAAQAEITALKSDQQKAAPAAATCHQQAEALALSGS